ncbi:MAG: 7-carboxy-7-deazaguanine synthase QueE [Microcoleaceae cyanobacterium]
MDLNLHELLPIHETFQNTVQGEGYWVGTPVDFIRLAGCPVQCHYCDTGYSTGGQGLPRSLRSVGELLAELQSPRVVISGGEPFIQGHLPVLVQAIATTGRKVSIETSGSFWQDVVSETWITLSPKEHISPKYPVLPQLWQRANEIKVVIETGTELKSYGAYLPSPRQIPIFLQPEWTTRDRTIPITLKLLQQFPEYRLSLQIHKYLGVP